MLIFKGLYYCHDANIWTGLYFGQNLVNNIPFFGKTLFKIFWDVSVLPDNTPVPVVLQSNYWTLSWMVVSLAKTLGELYYTNTTSFELPAGVGGEFGGKPILSTREPLTLFKKGSDSAAENLEAGKGSQTPKSGAENSEAAVKYYMPRPPRPLDERGRPLQRFEPGERSRSADEPEWDWPDNLGGARGVSSSGERIRWFIVKRDWEAVENLDAAKGSQTPKSAAESLEAIKASQLPGEILTEKTKAKLSAGKTRSAHKISDVLGPTKEENASKTPKSAAVENFAEGSQTPKSAAENLDATERSKTKKSGVNHVTEAIIKEARIEGKLKPIFEELEKRTLAMQEEVSDGLEELGSTVQKEHTNLIDFEDLENRQRIESMLNARSKLLELQSEYRARVYRTLSEFMTPGTKKETLLEIINEIEHKKELLGERSEQHFKIVENFVKYGGNNLSVKKQLRAYCDHISNIQNGLQKNYNVADSLMIRTPKNMQSEYRQKIKYFLDKKLDFVTKTEQFQTRETIVRDYFLDLFNVRPKPSEK